MMKDSSNQDKTVSQSVSEISNVIDNYKRIAKEWKILNSQIKEASIIFVDLTGSTEYKSNKGILLGIEKVINFNLDVSKIIIEGGKKSKKNGEIEDFEICKYIGDEVMAYFKGPNCAKTAAEIAIRIQKHFEKTNVGRDEFDRFKPKIGIDWGEVLFAKFYENSPYDPYGIIVDRAARIVSLAKPQQILISSEARFQADQVSDAYFGKDEKRIVKGFGEAIKIHELIWKAPIGIKLEEDSSAYMISSDPIAVYQYIKQENLLSNCNEIHFCLYTAETLASNLRPDLEKRKTPLKLKFLIRNPHEDPRKEAQIKSSIGQFSEMMVVNPKLTFDVRFYDAEPMLRTYIFQKEDGKEEGLLGIYKYDPTNPMRFVGAEFNELVISKCRSDFEKRQLALYSSRFKFLWDDLTTSKAVIFDLDGVVIDSMPYYYKAWKSAFEIYGIRVTEEEIYLREGEKMEKTAKEVYEREKGKTADDDIIKNIINNELRVYQENFQLKIFPGIKDLIYKLKEKNVRLGLVTGSISESIRQFAKEDDIFGKFDAIVTGDETSNGKPAPEPYNLAIKKLGISPLNCCAVENGPLGIRSAADAGLTCFAVKGNSPLPLNVLKGAGSFYVCKDISDLTKCLLWVDANMYISEFILTFKNNLALSIAV